MRVKSLVVSFVLLASPVWAQDSTAVVEHRIEDYADASGKMTHAIERTFLVMPDGTRLRLKGVTLLKTGDTVKVKKAKIRKPQKAHAAPERTEAEVNAEDLEPAPVIQSFISTEPTTVKRLRILRADLGSGGIQDVSMQSHMDAVKTQYLKNTYGKLEWIIDIYPNIPVPRPYDCQYTAVAGAVQAGLAARGITIAPADKTVFVMPGLPGCAWAGLAILGGGTAWVIDLHTTTHEVGHTLGMSHSGSSRCDASGCQHSEYGDDDPMGHGGMGSHFNGGQKDIMRWITPLVVSASGTFVLDPYETMSTGVKALKLLALDPNGRTEPWYVTYISGLDQVRIHKATTLQAGALGVGQSLTLPYGTVITREATPGTATIRVAYVASPVPPVQITGLRVANPATLEWGYPSTAPPVTGFQVQVYPSAYVNIGLPSGPSGLFTYRLTNPPGNYTVFVRGVNGTQAGPVAATNVQIASTPPPTVLPQITGVTLTVPSTPVITGVVPQ